MFSTKIKDIRDQLPSPVINPMQIVRHSMEDNIDTSDSASHNKMYRIQQLYDDLQNYISTFNLNLHNKEFTRYVPHQPPSTIDHISSNCPRKNLFEICNRYSYFLLTKNMT